MSQKDFESRLQQWLSVRKEIDADALVASLSKVIDLGDAPNNPYDVDVLDMGLEIANQILHSSTVEIDTLAVAIAFPFVYYHQLSNKQMEAMLDAALLKTLNGVLKMDMVPVAASPQPRFRQSLDNMRKLMLAMVDDFRIVLIKLAERLVVLMHLRDLPESARLPIALEVQRVYAPLANRMGIGHLKWQLEDLAFRYIEPEAYHGISKSLSFKRLDHPSLMRALR